MTERTLAKFQGKKESLLKVWIEGEAVWQIIEPTLEGLHQAINSINVYAIDMIELDGEILPWEGE